MQVNSHTKKSASGRIVLFALSGLALAGALCTAAEAGLAARNDPLPSDLPSSTVSDGFETSKPNRRVWWMGQAQEGQFWSDARVSRADRRSIAVRVTTKMRGCGAKCQRNEIRTAPQHRIMFGQEAWYSFSFRLDGKLPTRTTKRWVSGQWKQQCGGSPFLAQRFDRGAFQITVQDNSCRVIVASSEGLDQKLPVTLRTGKISGKPAQPRQACRSDIKVQYSANPTLPDPYGKWVDMSYRVRGGRNGSGLVEIWANGRFIARVTGSIGYDHMSGPHQYFKFGIYRAPVPGASVVRLDRFRRSGPMSTRSVIDGS